MTRFWVHWPGMMGLPPAESWEDLGKVLTRGWRLRHPETNVRWLWFSARPDEQKRTSTRLFLCERLVADHGVEITRATVGTSGAGRVAAHFRQKGSPGSSALFFSGGCDAKTIGESRDNDQV
jgi:hypothetical protein